MTCVGVVILFQRGIIAQDGKEQSKWSWFADGLSGFHTCSIATVCGNGMESCVCVCVYVCVCVCVCACVNNFSGVALVMQVFCCCDRIIIFENQFSLCVHWDTLIS